jgi:hypothetical protein
MISAPGDDGGFTGVLVAGVCSRQRAKKASGAARQGKFYPPHPAVSSGVVAIRASSMW